MHGRVSACGTAEGGTEILLQLLAHLVHKTHIGTLFDHR